MDKEREIRHEPLDITTRQRRWITNAWTQTVGLDCQMFNYTEKKGFCPCGRKEVHLHHIMPKRYARDVLEWTREEINNPKNIIPICPRSHLGRGYPREMSLDHHNGEPVDIIHTDIAWAFRNYKPEENNSFKRVMSGRNVLVDKGDEYWNPDYDFYLVERAREVVDNYVIMNPNDHYPNSPIFRV